MVEGYGQAWNCLNFLRERIPPLVFILLFAYFVATFPDVGPVFGRRLSAG
jgi:hypothetical protein